jgi:hypothetical protein
VWRWPGYGGWHFVTLDKKLFVKIREKYGKGMIKVIATLGKTTWKTSLFPHTQSGSYLICINKSVRKHEAVYEEDEVKVLFTVCDTR